MIPIFRTVAVVFLRPVDEINKASLINNDSYLNKYNVFVETFISNVIKQRATSSRDELFNFRTENVM